MKLGQWIEMNLGEWRDETWGMGTYETWTKGRDETWALDIFETWIWTDEIQTNIGGYIERPGGRWNDEAGYMKVRRKVDP